MHGKPELVKRGSMEWQVVGKATSGEVLMCAYWASPMETAMTISNQAPKWAGIFRWVLVTSVTNLVSIRNTWVFLTALKSVPVPLTLRLGMRRDSSHCIPHFRGQLFHTSYSCDALRSVLYSPPLCLAFFIFGPECCDVYTQSERHVWYTLRRASLTL